MHKIRHLKHNPGDIRIEIRTYSECQKLPSVGSPFEGGKGDELV